jgi:hypothetical protein
MKRKKKPVMGDIQYPSYPFPSPSVIHIRPFNPLQTLSKTVKQIE